MPEIVARRILIVDDEANILSMLSGLLRDEGFETRAAARGEEALEALRAAPFDLAIFDVGLPDIDGIALLERTRALRPDMPVVMISGKATIDLAVRAVRLGAFDFLEKGDRASERLLVVVRNALEHGALLAENKRLREERTAEPLLGESPPMRTLREEIARVAPTRGRVLILGESGTGKELVARALHEQSDRAAGPFVKMNCAAIPRDLIESTLFGHEKGSFTGASASAPGKFEQAHRGTLLLDEVGDMHLDTQAKLLRVLESSEVERVGGRRTIAVDVRVIAATNKDPAEEIAHGRFRDDLYFRLAVVPLTVPPLRERGEDITLLATHFLGVFGREYGRPVPRITPAAREILLGHPWPGNVRELRNLMERAVILLGASEITDADVRRLIDSRSSPKDRNRSTEPARADQAGDPSDAAPLSERLERFERDLIAAALERHGGRVADAARALRTDRANLHRKMRRLGIRRPEEHEEESGGREPNDGSAPEEDDEDPQV